MRSDWGDDATYCCFDIGPLGMGHFHQDKLNINIFKGGEELIYDDGGGLYDTSIYRIYGPSAAAHNTILVDGLVQMRDAQRVSKTAIDAAWISNEKIDYARGTYDDEWGIFTFDLKAENSLSKIAAHTREVLFIKPDFFCVQDTLKSLDGKNHSYEMRLQLDTIKVRKVDSIPGAYISDYNRTYDILIVPLFTDDLNSKLLSKIDTPPMAGWFVGRNDNNVHPSTTLTMTVSDRQDCRFATLLIPLHRNEVLPEITKQNENIFQIKFRGKLYSIDLKNLADK